MSTSLLEELALDAWNPVLTAATQAAAIDTLEAGRILYLPRLRFALMPHEHRFLSAEWSDGDSKNINLRGGGRLLRALRVTKRSRSEYDHLMLQLHDRVKADVDYQRRAPQEQIDFPIGTTWIMFSDQVLHAAMSGQFAMEETLMLPVNGMRAPESSPLRVLERMTGHLLT